MAKKYHVFQRIGRQLKLSKYKLLRSSAGAGKVALGFAIGFGLEMIVISTLGLVYILFYPIVRICRGSLPASIIGNIVGKLTFLPVILLPVARMVGKFVYPFKAEHYHVAHPFRELLTGNFEVILIGLKSGIHILIGMTIFGVVLGGISYFIVYDLYERNRKHQLNKKSKMSPMMEIE